MRYIITVDRALLDSDPSNPQVVRIEDTQTGVVTHRSEVTLPTRNPLDEEGVPVIRSGPPRQDGARVWIETDVWE